MLDGTVVATGEKVAVAIDITPDMIERAKAAILEEVEDRLLWNVRAYGKAWTEEHEDTVFIVGNAAEKALCAALQGTDDKGEDR